MTVSSYFPHFTSASEQNLLSDLNREAIQQKGYDFLYLPRRFGNYKEEINQDDMSYFDTTYTLEMYIKNVEGFEGDGNFLAKFGMEIRDRITLSVSRQRYLEEVGDEETNVRPKEGDLIFFPMTKRMFEIVFVDNKEIFYPLGILPLFSLSCEVYEYSMEKFDTGIPEIDAIQTNYSLDEVPHRLEDGDGDPIFNPDGSFALDPDFDREVVDAEYDNDVLKEVANTDVSFNIVNPFG